MYKNSEPILKPASHEKEFHYTLLSFMLAYIGLLWKDIK